MTAGFLDEPSLVTREQIEAWAADFDSWDVCDQVTTNLFDRTPFAWELAAEFSAREETFVKRCGFVMMAGLAVHAKDAEHDEALAAFLPLVERGADRRPQLREEGGELGAPADRQALPGAERGRGRDRRADLAEQADSPAARWVARDALRELTDPTIRSRIKR